MNREFLTFDSEQAWLDLRKQDITSTECAALFGCGAYEIKTPYSLYQAKTGAVEFPFSENDRTRWGNRLEAAIAYGIAEDFGLIVEPFKVYARIPELRMGSSFDFKITGIVDGWKGDDESIRVLFQENGPGIMEVKNVDGLQFKRAWIADDEAMEAPAHIELQVQHQQEVADMDWTLIAPLVGGNTPRPFARIRDRSIGAMITEKVAEFWHQVATGQAPEPDFSQDGATIAQLLANDNGKTVDMSDNNRLAELVEQYQVAGAEIKAAELVKDAAKAEILTIIGANAKVMLSGRYINAGTTKDSLGTLIEPHMVGTRIGGRKGYRMMRVYQSKQ